MTAAAGVFGRRSKERAIINRYIMLGVALVLAFALPPAVARAPVAASHTNEVRADLGMLAPRDFSIQSRPRGVRWLRFDTIVVNVGAADFRTYGHQDPADATDKFAVVQQTWSGTVWVDHPTDAVMSYSGDGHDHWHVEEFQHWTIQNENAQVLSSGAKTGFCFWDNYRYGSAAPAYYHPDTTSACELDTDGTVPMGLSVGWGDEYPSTIAYQYIDITGLPNGKYKVTLVADPHNHFTEAMESNNVSWAWINITRKGVTVLSTGSGV